MAKSKKKAAKKDIAAQEFEHSEKALQRRAKKFSGKSDEKERDFSYTQNRELSWLRFNERVLDEAKDPNVPLFERLKFVSIFASNLDEWFMVRVGGLSDLCLLKHQPHDSKTNLTPKAQLKLLFPEVKRLCDKASKLYLSIEEELEAYGLKRFVEEDLSQEQRLFCKNYFDNKILPLISPLVLNERHPLPKLKNGELYLICSLEGEDEKDLLGLVELPSSFERVVPLPADAENFNYLLLEDLLKLELTDLFEDMQISDAAIIRITRNADIDPDGEGVSEDEDYRQHMKKVLKRRQRLQPIRLEHQGELSDKIRVLLEDKLSLEPSRFNQSEAPLKLSYIFQLESKLSADAQKACCFEPFLPQNSPLVAGLKPMREQIEDHDVLLAYPYERMEPLLRLLREAAQDEDCVSIQITLYRVAKQSKLCEALIQAAEAGKEVRVLMELRARFDEENNIQWAERLESAGCTVIYGSEGYKVHSKICLISYRAQDRIVHISCLGTGNFNEKTAALYCDFMLLTAHERLGEDAAEFFKNLHLARLKGDYKELAVAPYGLKSMVMAGLDAEIEKARLGEQAQVFLKLNSLTDRDVIDKLVACSNAGVRVVLMVRGICCILPDIAGKTENVAIRQIVGRFLEHARIYAFGVRAEKLYLSSADMMTRNTERRVEIAFPILDERLRGRLISYINIQLADNQKARRLSARGSWAKLDSAWQAEPVSAQDLMLKIAYAQATKVAPELMLEETELYIHPAVPQRAKELPPVSSYSAREIPLELEAKVIDSAPQKAENPRDNALLVTNSSPSRLRLAAKLVYLGIRELIFGSLSSKR